MDASEREKQIGDKAMIVDIPNCRWRIRGESTQWTVECENEKRAGGYREMYYFPSLEHAIGKAYELMLRESDATVDISDVPAECRKAKDALVKAVRKAVG